MKKLFPIMLVVLLAILIAVPAAAAQPASSGKAINPRVLEAVFIHYDKPAKPNKPSTTLPPVDNSYFQIIGPKWDLTNYPSGVLFTVNPSGAPDGAYNEIAAAFEAWDAATSKELFSTPALDYNAWWGSRDSRNNISWQVLSGGKTIAATWIWYNDNDGSGNMSAGDEVIENDIVFNATMKWGIDADGEGTLTFLKRMYDVRNIATHEIGHVVGLDDLYDAAYRDLTMYGYGSQGETKKISLEAGDKAGTAYLYP